MADITLTSLPSTASVQGVQTTGVSTSATGTPTLLPNMPSGTLLRGFVLNRDPQGNPVLRTPQGDFTVQSDLFLKIGSDVVARITTPGNNARASILSVDGHSPQEMQHLPAGMQTSAPATNAAQQRPAQNAPAQTTQTQAQPPAQAPAVVRQSSTLVATLLRPAPTSPDFGQPQQPQATPSLPAGTQITFRLVSAAPPQVQAQTQVQLPTGEGTHTNTPAAPQAPAPPMQQYSAYARNFGTTVVNVPEQRSAPQQNIQLPQAGTVPQAPARAAISTVQAQVTTQDSSGNSVAETPLGTVRLENAPPMPPGTRLTLEVVSTAPAAKPLTDATPASIPQLASDWESLSQIVGTLLQESPDTATHFLRLAMPASAFSEFAKMENLNPTAQNLTAGISRFANALSGGDLFTWLGSSATAVLQERGHSTLLSRTADEFDAMRSLWVDTKPGTWQAMFVPVMVEGQVRPLRAYIKRERSNAKERNKKSDTRFVVEMELSATGALQLDGLVRKREGSTQFDLMIRSRNGFTAEEQRDIIDIYFTIGGATGYSGSVAFQQTSEFPVRPLEEILAQRHKDWMA